MSGDIIDIELITQHKENIQPLKEGRSVTALANTFSTEMSLLKGRQSEERSRFEELLKESQELDDPLQVYIDYLGWIENNYPSGQNVESGLLPLLERCTSQFRDAVFYKDDPRYLRIWLKYTNYSDNKRDVFVYLAKKEIGKHLATYYEEFAKYLELERNKTQAEQMYQMGIKMEARPIERLKRRYNEFKERMALEPCSEIESFDPIRGGILSDKSGIIAANKSNEDGIGPLSKPFDSSKPKLQVFQDDMTSESLSIFENDHVEWKSLGTISSRTKENRMKPRPWNGEILKQQTSSSSPLLTNKFNVFKDISAYGGPVTKIIEVPGKKTEKIDLNLDLLYPSTNEEFCLDELLAMAKGVYEKKRKLSMTNSPSFPRSKIQQKAPLQPKPLPIETVTTTTTIQLKGGEDGDSQDQKRPPSPTLTMLSRQARDEVFSMFNKKIESIEPKNFDSENEDTNYDGFVTETINIKPNTNTKLPEFEEQSKHSAYFPDDSASVQSSPFLDTPMKGMDTQSQPIPILSLDGGVNEGDDLILNPLDYGVKDQLLSSLTPPISSYTGLYQYDYESSMSQKFKKMTKNGKVVAVGSKNSIIEFQKSNEMFCIRSELGEGGYATVYLAESEEGQLRALKVERPQSVWEYYILKQIQLRLSNRKPQLLDSIIRPKSLHLYQDEGYLIMEYQKQGTILDICNLFKSNSSLFDESLVMFVSVELLKVIQGLHAIGIMHGDLKPDNCMVRFHNCDNWNNKYDIKGKGGWSSKGITLIDFGRAIDMSLFPHNIKFKSDWAMDSLDCPEMREGKPWTYEADYYGLASIIHMMLFGKHIEAAKEGGMYKLSNPLRRYWQTELWTSLFNVLLNPNSVGTLPINNVLDAHRRSLETWLTLNGTNLKSSIKEVQYSLNEQAKKSLSKH